MEKRATGIWGIKIALICYSALVALQLVAFFLTDILVLLALALEMLSDVLISAFLLSSIFWSMKPADEIHMFGYKRIQNVAALVAAVISISFMSLETFRKAIPKFFQVPKPVELQSTNLTLMVIIVGMIVIAIPTVYILHVKAKGASVKAQFVALVRDEVSYVVALIATILVDREFHLADPLASTFIGVVILAGGLYILKANVYYLVGKAPSKESLEKIESIAKSVKGVLGIHDLKAEYVGPKEFHAGFHIEVAKGTPIEECDKIAHEVERRVIMETDCVHCVIHVDPANGS